MLLGLDLIQNSKFKIQNSKFKIQKVDVASRKGFAELAVVVEHFAPNNNRILKEMSEF
jgi:hypothetical protein